MNGIQKFLFVVPNSRWFGKRCWMWFTPSVTLLAPIVKALGYQVEVVEANIDNLSRDEVRERVRAFAPDVVGITSMSLEYWRQAHETARLVKEADPKIVTVMGGVHPTSLPERVMADANIDFAILGEGEERLPRFLKILGEHAAPEFSEMDGVAYRQAERVIIRPATAFVEDLDRFPLPDYRFLNWDKVMRFQQGAAGGMGTKRTPVGTIMTSRGCPFRCCFCAGWRTMGRKMRLRSVANVLREVDMLVRDYGVREIVFQDDEMYANVDRAVAIVEGIRQRKYDLIWKNSNLASWRMNYELLKLMKESGCYQITISPESGSDRVLREVIHKPAKKADALRVSQWCRDLGLELQADFVIGFPGETWDEIRQTTAFAEELDADSVKFAIATPFPGTELCDVAMAQGLLPRDFDFYRDDALGFAKGVIETDAFTIPELQMLRCFEWDRINFKTPEKTARYARLNQLSLEELEQFRKETRRRIGIYFVDQSKAERHTGDEARAEPLTP